MIKPTKENLGQINVLLKQLSSNIKPITFEDLQKVRENGEVALVRNKEDNKIVGMGTIVYIKTMTGLLGRIEDVVVDENHRGRGIGKGIVLALIQMAEKRCVKHIDLTSSPSRKTANALYRKLGFKKRKTNVYRLAFEE